MAQQPDHKRVVRFGTFEADLAAGELRQSGKRVKLQDQPFRLLALLLERPGEVVPREELRSKLWGGAFVDFEDGLNTSVRKIRDALGDSATTPRFIETIPRHGYRFIGPVEVQTITRGPRRSRLALYGLTGLAVLVAGALIWVLTRMLTVPPPPLLAIPFTSLPGAEVDPCFSPDGRQVAFAWNGGERGDFDIYVQETKGGKPVRLTQFPADEIGPAWSPDGSKVAFLRAAGAEHGVHIIPALGGPERRLVTKKGGPWSLSWSLSWSAEGEWIALTDVPAPDEGEAVVQVSVLTGRKRWLTKPPRGLEDRHPQFSPDGRSLAFERGVAGSSGQLYVVSTQGGDPRPLTRADSIVWGFAWTPDGREIVASIHSGFAPGLWRIPADGSQEAKATPLGLGEKAGWPAISRPAVGGPSRMVYGLPQTDFNIWRLEIDPSGHHKGAAAQVAPSTRLEHGPSFSPDGSKIALVSSRTGLNQVWACATDGSGELQLTSLDQGDCGSPSWSPDGARIAFDRTVEGNRDVYVVRAEGGPVQRMTLEASMDGLPSWSREGQWIYFMSERSGSRQIWKLPVVGGAAIQVTKNGGYQAFESPDGKLLYYAKTRYGRGIWAVPVAGGEEKPVLEEAWHNCWGVAEDGIYYIDLGAEAPPPSVPTGPPKPVKQFRFDTGRIRQVAEIRSALPRGYPSFAVSRDGKQVLWVGVEHNVDLMLVQDFR